MNKILLIGIATIGGVAFNLFYRWLDHKDKDVKKKELLYDSPVNRCKCNNEHCLCNSNSNRRKEIL